MKITTTPAIPKKSPIALSQCCTTTSVTNSKDMWRRAAKGHCLAWAQAHLMNPVLDAEDE
jgi:hypothetical protein